MTEPNEQLKARIRAVIVHLRSRITKDADIEFVPPERWDEVAGDDPTNLHRPFGFFGPSVGGPRLVVHFCAERIAEQSLFLDDEDAGRYLSYVEAHMHMHISHLEEVLSGFYTIKELEGVIDRTLSDSVPRMVEIANAVQMRALDPEQA